MRRTHLALSALVVSAALALAGCSGDTSETKASATPGATPTAVDCAALTVDSENAALPAVAGDAGAEPTLTWTGQEAPANLTVQTLTAGSGPQIQQTSTVTVQYAGWQWGTDTTFDSSYQRGKPASFPLNQVIPGWKCGLAGHNVGDRLLMSIPGDLAYGDASPSAAAADAQQQPTGPLVFVVEVTASSNGTADATMEGEQAVADRGVTVTGELGKEASISVNAGAAEPTSTEVIVLARGTGAPITAEDSLQVNLAFSSWDGQIVQSSWKGSGQPQYIPLAQAPNLQGLVGVPVGSRVVVLMAAGTSGEGTPMKPYAYVIDIESAVQ